MSLPIKIESLIRLCHIVGLADTVNKYIDDNATAVVKEDKLKAAEICTSGLNALRLLMIYLKPVLPEISKGSNRFSILTL